MDIQSASFNDHFRRAISTSGRSGHEASHSDTHRPAFPRYGGSQSSRSSISSWRHGDNQPHRSKIKAPESFAGSTSWCSDIGSLTSLDVCNSGASSDHRTNFTAPGCMCPSGKEHLDQTGDPLTCQLQSIQASTKARLGREKRVEETAPAADNIIRTLSDRHRQCVKSV